ncbi:hypothetical protein D9756_009481 [Leucocoprinus leucothites]|uniref:Uncharacterized protein n=1 Tax=Leucocoprinus leucothites TaxID=201217 RepID=A0A8H5CY22_9AGAR|nr:hypothetical protein D9756_009481 [Leucoagaricus leucothites]
MELLLEMTLGVALVTGAANGIGRSIALRLAKDGFDVAVNDIGHQDLLASLQDEIKTLGRNSIECIADVTKEEEVKTMVNETVERLGGLDVISSSLAIARKSNEFGSDGGQCGNIIIKVIHGL